VNLANELCQITFSKFSVKSFLDHLSDLTAHSRQSDAGVGGNSGCSCHSAAVWVTLPGQGLFEFQYLQELVLEFSLWTHSWLLVEPGCAP